MAEERHATSAGVELDETTVRRLADEAERGYEPQQLRQRPRGRPPIGAQAATVFHVRLQPRLRAALKVAAEAEETTPSDLVRRALAEYLASRSTVRDQQSTAARRRAG